MKKLYCLFLSLSLALTPIAGADAKRVFAEASPSIVVVLAPDGEGSGVVVGEGVVVTNCHVVEDAEKVHIRQAVDARSAETYLMNAEVIAEDQENDLCLLYAEDLTIPPAAPAAKLGEAQGLVIGEDVYAIGAPQGLELSLSRGIVAQLRGIKGEPPTVQTDAAISPGSSGGGLFNEKGELIGITTYKRTDGESLNFAMPVEMVTALMQTAYNEMEERKAQAARWQECMINPQYQCVLTFAQQIARQVDDVFGRALTFGYIASAQAEAGNFEDARVNIDNVLYVARQTDYLTEQVELLSIIAEVQSKLGDSENAKISIENAIEAVKQIRPPSYHAEALAQIIIAQSEIGNFKDAQEMAQQIDDDSFQGFVLGIIAFTQVEVGDFKGAKINIDNALHMVENSDNAFLHALVLSIVVAAQSKMDRSDDVELAIDDVLHAIGQIDDAFLRSSALGFVAFAQNEIGNLKDAKINFDNALYEAKQVYEDSDRDDVLRITAAIQAEAGYFTGAMQTAQLINDNAEKAQALASIAKALTEK